MDPYQLLGVSKKFTLDELKEKYKNLALKVHPDKGGTEELFLLVTKCYKLLLAEYNRRVSQREFHELKAEFKKIQAHSQGPRVRPSSHESSTTSSSKFDLDKFNKIFSENKLSDAFDNGYKDWMSDEQVKDIPKPKGSFTPESFNSAFEKATIDKSNKYIVKYREPEPLMASKRIGFTELGQEDINDFSGDNTTKKNLNFMDYKVAHTTSRIVDPSLVKNMKQYKNVEELERHRGSISFNMEEETMQEYLARQKQEKMAERKRLEALKKQERMMQEQYERVNMLMLGRKPQY